jgi:AcrR family transcriptional regulator
MSKPARNDEEIKEKILVSAINLFSTKGYNDTSVSDITNNIKMSKRTLYETYNNKEELLEDCCKRIRQSIEIHTKEMFEHSQDHLFLFMFFTKISSLMDIRYHKLQSDLQEKFPELYTKYFSPDSFLDRSKLVTILNQAVRDGDIIANINAQEFTRILSLLGKLAVIAYPNSLKLQKVFVDMYSFTLIRGSLSPKAIHRYDQLEESIDTTKIKQYMLKALVPQGYNGDEYINDIISNTNEEMLLAGKEIEEKAKRPDNRKLFPKWNVTKKEDKKKPLTTKEKYDAKLKEQKNTWIGLRSSTR